MEVFQLPGRVAGKHLQRGIHRTINSPVGGKPCGFKMVGVVLARDDDTSGHAAAFPGLGRRDRIN